MILTGPEIAKNVESGDIVISCFSKENLNPNSYNYTLGNRIKVFKRLDDYGNQVFEDIEMPETGYVFRPGKMYLGVTGEIIGSRKYAMSLIGRSSIGRYGFFLQISADLGHTTSCHKWTLEMYACRPIKLYPGMNIGQVSFWVNSGPIKCFGKKYANFNQPMEKQHR